MALTLSPETYSILVSVRVAVVVLGLLIAFMAYRSYRRNHSNSMLFLAIGFVLITFGATIEGVLFEFFAMDLFQAHAVESLIVVVAFLVIIFSIFGSKT